MLKSKIKENYYETSLDTTRSNSNEIWFRSNNVRNEQVISKLYIKGLRSLFCCAKALNRVSLIIWEHPAYQTAPADAYTTDKLKLCMEKKSWQEPHFRDQSYHKAAFYPTTLPPQLLTQLQLQPQPK